MHVWESVTQNQMGVCCPSKTSRCSGKWCFYVIVSGSDQHFSCRRGILNGCQVTNFGQMHVCIVKVRYFSAFPSLLHSASRVCWLRLMYLNKVRLKRKKKAVWPLNEASSFSEAQFPIWSLAFQPPAWLIPLWSGIDIIYLFEMSNIHTLFWTPVAKELKPG